jgi:hypothetical protein
MGEFAVVWERVLQDVGPMRGAQLRYAGLPATFGPNSLVIRFPPDYSSAYESCASESGTEVIRQALRRATGKEWSVRFEQAAGADAGPVPQGAAPPPRPEQRAKDLLQLPLFRKAADVLGAQLVRVDDGFDPHAEREPVWSAAGPAAGAPDPDEV